jgi:hypothetical protein
MFRRLSRYLKSLLGELHVSLRKVHLTRHDSCFITCAGRTDGGGAQVHGIWSTMLFAREMGLTYVHTPLVSVDHKPAGTTNWEAKWEQFFNLGAGEMTRDELATPLNVISLEPTQVWKIRRRPNTLYTIPHCHGFADAVPARYKTIQEANQKKYDETPKPCPLRADLSRITVAVHVRRGDVKKGNVRFTSDTFILNAVRQIHDTAKLLGAIADVHLYSEGVDTEFESLAQAGITLHLKEPAFEAFHQLRSAHVLVMAKSSFSYVAALYSNGVKIYEKFWHNPMRDWVQLNTEGMANARELQAALTSLRKEADAGAAQ